MRTDTLLTLLVAPLACTAVCGTLLSCSDVDTAHDPGGQDLDTADELTDTGAFDPSVLSMSLIGWDRAQFQASADGSLRAQVRRGLSAQLDADGLVAHVGPDELGLATVSYGSVLLGQPEPQLHDCAPIAPTESRCPSGASLDHGALTEWWTSDGQVLRQGWTLQGPQDDEDVVTIEVGVTSGDLLGVDPDGLAASLQGSTGGLWRYTGLLAWDADGLELPAHLEAHEGNLRVVVDTVGARWPVTVDPTLGSEDKLTPSDGAKDDYYGGSVASAGDLDGDGYGDVIVGAHEDDDSGSASGSVYVYYGSSTGLLASSEQKLTASDGGTLYVFGTSVAGAGDVDGDGYGDIVVGAKYSDQTAKYAGSAYVYYGSSTGIVASSEQGLLASDGAAADFFGNSVASAGDLDADGYGDVIVGASGVPAAYVYYGSSTGLLTASELKLDPSSLSSSSYFGHAVAGAGDVDGDGYDDVLVGAYAQSSHGVGLLFYGSSSGLLASSMQTIEPSDGASGDYFGYAVAGAGDLDGDGYADVALGAYKSGNGSVYVYFGSSTGLDSSSEQKVSASDGHAYQYYGRSGLSIAGDIDNDGYDDLLVGADRDDGAANDAGAAYVYFGSSTGLDESSEEKVTSSDVSSSDQFGVSVGIGDLDADGYADVIVGAKGDDDNGSSSGSVYALYGACRADTDGDGVCDNDDCGPSDATIYPGATEVVGDEIDQDCDDTEICYVDADDDGYTDGSSTVASEDTDCSDSGEGTSSDPTGECDDTNAAVNPGATEGVGDGVDSDCDGEEVCYVDADEDGYTDGSSTVTSSDEDCDDAGEGTDTDPTGDCDDSDEERNPSVTEAVGDEVDSDCDGGEVCYADADADGFTDGSTVDSTDEDCTDAGEATDILAEGDCDDADAAIYPGALDPVGDEVDQDCDGIELCYVDEDGDGYIDGTSTVSSTDADCSDAGEASASASTGDCDDRDGDIHPGATETVGDGVDSDCDGQELCYPDADLDGYVDTSSTQTSVDADCSDLGEGDDRSPSGDCDDSDATIHPAATELAGDEVDQDCDGTEICYADADLDGYPDPLSTVASEDTDCVDEGEGSDKAPELDCDDADATIHPGATEGVADGLDQDCDGEELCYADTDDDGYIGSTSDGEATVPSEDADCDDAGEATTEDATGDCDDANPTVNPGVAERPGDEVDSDCDGAEVCYADADEDGYPDFEGTLDSEDTDCRDAGEGVVGQPTGECDDADASVHPDAEEIEGDGIDQDCDGEDPAAPADEEEPVGRSRGCTGCTASGSGSGLSWLGVAGVLGLARRRRRDRVR